jgi:hypothetical protein
MTLSHAQRYATGFAQRMIETHVVAWGSLDTWEVSPEQYRAALRYTFPTADVLNAVTQLPAWQLVG